MGSMRVGTIPVFTIVSPKASTELAEMGTQSMSKWNTNKFSFLSWLEYFTLQLVVFMFSTASRRSVSLSGTTWIGQFHYTVPTRLPSQIPAFLTIPFRCSHSSGLVAWPLESQTLNLSLLSVHLWLHNGQI